MIDDLIKKDDSEEGAPAWVVTFGDLMSLLLCFFVMLLSFSEMDRNIYKEIAGSMAKAFGVQRKIQAFESPRGEKIVARDFEMQVVATREKEELGRELKKEIETKFQDLKDLMEIELSEHEIVIRLMGETTFDSGRAQIKPQMIPFLNKIASVLKDAKGDIVIAGHTDNVPVTGGEFTSNLQLSAERAVRVAEYLMNREPVDPQKISTTGFGEYRPLASNDTPEGREKNRRVEIILKSADSIRMPIKRE
jgi:chemotaxis protein MotB